jgi:riboflavin synthase
MFNGIIYKTGLIKSIKKMSKSTFIGIQTKLKLNKTEIGSSICCDGVCLTVVEIKKDIIFFYISNETLKRSNFNLLKKKQIINLEKSISYGQNISGHFIQGHVDTIAKVKKVVVIDKTWIVNFEIRDKELGKYLIEKASISINGVSLTISKVSKFFFEVSVIPHSLKLTNLKILKRNSLVNIELDIFGKYMYKYLN